jgi:hypothetical protein
MAPALLRLSAITGGGILMATSAVAFNQAMRKLWSDHVVWTRLYIIEALDRTPLSEQLTKVASGVVEQIGTAIGGAVQLASAGDAAAIRLLRNQEEIGNAIVPFYGKDAGNKLTAILKKHILIAVELVAAAKADDDAAFQRKDKEWDENAHEIAGFLSGANPNWQERDVYDLLDQHLRLTKAEATARLKKDWATDVKTFDDIYTEAMVIADTLANGIKKQFASKFTDMAAQEADLETPVR